MITDTDIAYIAGIIDGEGSIGVYKNKNTKRSQHQMQVRVAMREDHAVNMLVNIFGARYNNFRNKTGIVYRAVFTGPRAYEFLKLIRKYLRVKLDQANLAIEFYEICIGKSGKRTTDSQIDLRNKYEFRLKEMKKPNYQELAV